MKTITEQMYKALLAQHDALDRLFAMLVERDHTFFPSRSGQPWAAMVEGNEAIKRYGREARPPNMVRVSFTKSLMERLKEVMPAPPRPEQWEDHKLMIRPTPPIQRAARDFSAFIGEQLPTNSAEMEAVLWVFGERMTSELETMVNQAMRMMDDLMMRKPTPPIQSITGKTVKPFCADHKPVVKQLVHDPTLIEISCPNCSYRSVMSQQTYLELEEMIRVENGIRNASLES